MQGYLYNGKRSLSKCWYSRQLQQGLSPRHFSPLVIHTDYHAHLVKTIFTGLWWRLQCRQKKRSWGGRRHQLHSPHLSGRWSFDEVNVDVMGSQIHIFGHEKLNVWLYDCKTTRITTWLHDFMTTWLHDYTTTCLNDNLINIDLCLLDKEIRWLIYILHCFSITWSTDIIGVLTQKSTI